MPKVNRAVEHMPAAPASALKRLGQDLKTARLRRRESLRSWAERLKISAPTLMKMEGGDPAVSMGAYATALWLLQREQVLARAADPKEDVGALEADVREANSRHRPRSERG
ncbi:MAG: XRE family transcriptional regulator [Ramlibacter sp.]|nr:XRE family transcriptional regulator [Ramlibacter sp.]